MIRSPEPVACPQTFQPCDDDMDNFHYKEKAAALLRLKIARIKQERCVKEKQIKNLQGARTEAKIRRKEALVEKCDLQRKVALAERRRNKIESVLKTVLDIAAIIERQREETRRRNRAIVRDTPRGQELKKEITTLTKQSRDITRKYKCSVDRLEHFTYRLKKADNRAKIAEYKAQTLQKTLEKIVHILELMARRKRLRDAKTELESKNESGLETAEDLEERETNLEERIMELEDQIDHFKRKKQKVVSLLMEHKNNNSSKGIWSLAKLKYIGRASMVND